MPKHREIEKALKALKVTLEALKLCEKFVKWNNTIAVSTRSHLGGPKKYDVVITNIC